MTKVKLVPELYCSDFSQSLRFYVDLLGFEVRYARHEEGFAYLDLDGAELMIERPSVPERTWLAGELTYPFGRGISLQIEVTNVVALYERVQRAESPIFLALEDRWYRQGDREVGNRQFVALDPDGYLLRFFESLGIRNLTATAR